MERSPNLRVRSGTTEGSVDPHPRFAIPPTTLQPYGQLEVCIASNAGGIFEVWRGSLAVEVTRGNGKCQIYPRLASNALNDARPWAV